ncbi:MAG: endonuclease/exonuclease/phosphatase family protein [Proteobacteria bacterium]|nr:endonuclease/exonuclease/phosphatase family protein [Pseudomonadota bacterium]
MKIASYNIRKCVGLDRKRDPLRTLSVINTIPADIIALQEVDRRMGQRLPTLPFDQIEALTGMVPLDLGLPGPSLGWHGNGLLVRPNVAVSDVECLKLPGLEPRGAIILNADVDDSGPVSLVAVHLGLMRGNRKSQLKYLLDALANRSKQPTVIMGDFNEWSQKTGLGRLANDFAFLAPGKSFHATLPIAKLDRFALSKELYVKDAGVMEKGKARRASDHLPIWAEIAHR